MITDNTIANDNIHMPFASELQANFKGRILVEGDVGYETARKIWNGMIDRKPAIIAQCIEKGDIQNAVKFAKKHDLLVSVRGGGHNVSGNAVCDGGFMIDLSLMKSVKQIRRIRQPSLKWGLPGVILIKIPSNMVWLQPGD